MHHFSVSYTLFSQITLSTYLIICAVGMCQGLGQNVCSALWAYSLLQDFLHATRVDRGLWGFYKSNELEYLEEREK